MRSGGGYAFTTRVSTFRRSTNSCLRVESRAGWSFDRLRTERNGRWDHRSAPAVDDLDDLAAVYSL